jgi:hypothetical protein
MSSPFRTRLFLDEIESRLVPSAPLVGPAHFSAAQSAEEMDSLPYVFVDFAGMDNAPQDGQNDFATQLTISVTNDDGTSTMINVAIQPGQTNASVALAVASALRAEGYTIDVNGSAITIWGRGDSSVDSVSVGVTGATVGPDNPNLKPPTINGYNGATGYGYVALVQ